MRMKLNTTIMTLKEKLRREEIPNNWKICIFPIISSQKVKIKKTKNPEETTSCLTILIVFKTIPRTKTKTKIIIIEIAC